MKKTLVAAAVFAVGFFAFFLLTSVSEEDVFAFHKLDPPKSPEAVEAGDIVALSPDGLRSEKICDQDLAEALVDRGPIEDVYFNRVWERLDEFTRIFDVLPGLGNGPREIAFSGAKSSILEKEAALADMKESCECAMARALNSRSPVCTVRASLVEKRVLPGFQDGEKQRVTEVTVAYALGLFSNQVTEAQFKACNLEMSDAAKIAMQQECVQDGLPYDSVIRQRLKLIARKPILQANLQ